MTVKMSDACTSEVDQACDGQISRALINRLRQTELMHSRLQKTLKSRIPQPFKKIQAREFSDNNQFYEKSLLTDDKLQMNAKYRSIVSNRDSDSCKQQIKKVEQWRSAKESLEAHRPHIHSRAPSDLDIKISSKANTSFKILSRRSPNSSQLQTRTKSLSKFCLPGLLP